MGKKSTKEDKNIYFLSREEAGMTRAEAAEALYISEDRIERIEYEKSAPHPDEVLAMADCYKNPTLWNYFCAHECPIGREYVPEVKIKDLSQITLEMLANLNALVKEKDRLVEITVDGNITPDEMPDFKSIQNRLEEMSLVVDALKLWFNNAVSTGQIKE